MADDQPIERSPKRSLLRKILWVVGGGLGLLFLVNIFLPDLDLSGEDRIALIRIEGVILDTGLLHIVKERKVSHQGFPHERAQEVRLKTRPQSSAVGKTVRAAQ